MKTDNTLLLQGILSHLPDNIKKQMSSRIFIYDCLESTNITAKKMAAAGAEHGTVVFSNYQTSGKGRRGKTFHSPPDYGLYMSFILSNNQPHKEDTTDLITVNAAVAVCRAIESITDKRPKVKWVNDILLDGKKICGILTESVIGAQSHCVYGLILGIGINFSTPMSAFPKTLQQIAGSLFETSSPPVTRNHLAAEIIKQVIFPETELSKEELLDLYNQRLFIP